MDFADESCAGARDTHPFRDISVRSTRDIRNIDIASRVVVASLVATVVYLYLGRALGVRVSVRKRHTNES